MTMLKKDKAAGIGGIPEEMDIDMACLQMVSLLV